MYQPRALRCAVRGTAGWLAARLHIRSDRGATEIEYGLMVALIAMVIFISLVFLGHQVSTTFSCTSKAVGDPSTSVC